MILKDFHASVNVDTIFLSRAAKLGYAGIYRI